MSAAGEVGLWFEYSINNLLNSFRPIRLQDPLVLILELGNTKRECRHPSWRRGKNGATSLVVIVQYWLQFGI